MVVASYDGAGRLRWSAQLGTAENEYGVGVAAHGGNVYVVGGTYGMLDGNPSAGQEDAFIRKLDASGAKIWSRQFGTSWFDRGFGVATDLSENVFVAGRTDGSLDGIPPAGNGDAYVTSYDAMGNRR